MDLMLRIFRESKEIGINQRSYLPKTEISAKHVSHSNYSRNSVPSPRGKHPVKRAGWRHGKTIKIERDGL